ncbi:hypothetical protein [Candidatus Hakubella thermalkaliphila]|uniref:PIN domain-containing protein n=1 Tax=Candidatus Hakubella thermalkaliphila TaxID=2754717 RepID=A0A6V8P6Q4_9ACTN|nr:hypothetical protein [Candidatus Hakubella thermalkaliphila]GFP28037.1 hypothetical protein HKBW3S33_01454 [Candidatus Hakubella thermalkaliphila]GFP42882.1 hypothetical protein HKBW3C_02006 [Candidatus Hakubella thermalkaliphila]
MQTKIRQPLVISDTSPLVALGKQSRLDILKVLYGHIVIPPTVKEETERLLSGFSGLNTFQNSSWIEVRNSANPARSKHWRIIVGLGPGESEAVALAEEQPSLLLVDELKTRELLKDHPKITIVTTCEILFRAQSLGYLADMCDLLSEMVRSKSLRLAKKDFEKYCPNYHPSPYRSNK